MPGKVNPVIPEVVIQVADQVIGNDAAITLAGSQGQFELNVRVPLIARNLLDSIKLLAAAVRHLDEKCVSGIEPNEEMLERHAEADAGDGHRAQSAHRLRPGGGDRQGGPLLRPAAARGGEGDGRRGVDPRRGARPSQDGASARLSRRGATAHIRLTARGRVRRPWRSTTRSSSARDAPDPHSRSPWPSEGGTSPWSTGTHSPAPRSPRTCSTRTPSPAWRSSGSSIGCAPSTSSPSSPTGS